MLSTYEQMPYRNDHRSKIKFRSCEVKDSKLKNAIKIITQLTREIGKKHKRQLLTTKALN